MHWYLLLGICVKMTAWSMHKLCIKWDKFECICSLSVFLGHPVYQYNVMSAFYWISEICEICWHILNVEFHFSARWFVFIFIVLPPLFHTILARCPTLLVTFAPTLPAPPCIPPGPVSDLSSQLPPLVPASIWTRKDLRSFKDMVRKVPENVIKIGSLATATVSDQIRCTAKPVLRGLVKKCRKCPCWTGVVSLQVTYTVDPAFYYAFNQRTPLFWGHCF